MSNNPATVRLELPAEHRYLNIAGACAAALLERQPALSDPEILTYNVQLALQEACTNIVDHAYNLQAGAMFAITFSLHDTPARLIVDLHDTGQSFNPEAVSAPNLDEPAEGGYGMFLIRELMDDISYSTLPDGNHLQLVKNL